MSPLSDPGQIMQRLEEIDSDLARIRHDIGDAASRFFRTKRDYELELAKLYIANEGAQKERESEALIAVQDTAAYANFKAAEADYHATVKVISVLETRATIGQSLLKIYAKEAQYGG